MPLASIFDPAIAGRPMRVAAFMSGSGTNIRRLLEHQEMLDRDSGGSPFRVVFIFSDRSDGQCAGENIALAYGLPYFSYDIRTFHRLRGIKRTVLTPEGLAARQDYDRLAHELIRAFETDVVALGGYMSYTTIPNCVNVHPADLSLRIPEGRIPEGRIPEGRIPKGRIPEGQRKFVGDDAVRDAILAGEKIIRASTLWTDEGVDTGPLLMVSDPLEVALPEPLESLAREKSKLTEVVDAHQNRLKELGDWKIFPRTIQLIAEGRFALDESGRVYLDGAPVPDGHRE